MEKINQAEINQLETSRLLLRKFVEDDVEDIYSSWCSDPEVTAMVTWTPHKDLEETKRVLKAWLKAYGDPKTVRFGIVLKETGELVGIIDTVNFHSGKPEIGFCLARKCWGNGYMTEACHAMICHLFHLGYNNILACTHEENIGSIAVLQRCGFHFDKKEFRAQWSPLKLETVVLNWYHLSKYE